VSIVREALRRNTTCKAFGALHSITDIVCTEGIAIDMTGIRQMKMSRDGTTVMVGAGVSIRDLTDFLMIIGRALRGIPGFGNVTVGGVVGTGAHGTSLKYESTISDQLVSLLIVDGLGNLRTISDETDLRAFRVHLGLLGIIIQLTFKTVPLYKVRAHNYVLGDEILKNGVVEEMAKVTDQLGLYWFPSLQKVVVANWTFVDVRTPGNAETNDHVPSTTRSLNWYMNRFVERAARYDSLQTWHLGVAYFAATLYRKIPDNVPIYSEDGIHVQNPAVGFYHRMFAPICKSTGWIQCPWLHGNEGGISFTDNEFSFELSRLPEVISTVEDILSKYPAVFPVYGILLRFSKPSNTYMSTSYGRVTCHLEFYMKTRKNAYEDPSLGLAAYQAIVQSLVSRNFIFLFVQDTA
jgi:FAD/FMN-containing dehydrogenase